MATPNLVTFSDWQQKTNASLMSCAEELLEKLEDTSDLLSEIDEQYIRTDPETEDQADDRKSSMIQRFHAGLDSARNLVNMLKREKWRLSKREMSVELRMGELEDYKKHLKNDMSSLNQTVEALSLRVVQLENQLVEAQEVQENLEADLQEHKNSLRDANDRNIQLYTENEDLKKATQASRKSGNRHKENQMLQDEVSVLSQENSKLKDMVRDAEALASPILLQKGDFSHPLKRDEPPTAPPKEETQPPKSPATAAAEVEERETTTKKKKTDDNLSKLTKEFLDELTSLELRENGSGNVGSASAPSPSSSSSSSSSCAAGVAGSTTTTTSSGSSTSSAPTVTKKVTSADV